MTIELFFKDETLTTESADWLIHYLDKPSSAESLKKAKEKKIKILSRVTVSSTHYMHGNIKVIEEDDVYKSNENLYRITAQCYQDELLPILNHFNKIKMIKINGYALNSETATNLINRIKYLIK